MRTRLHRRLRFKAGLAAAALYAFCILMPHAALALSGPLAHCLTEAGPAHVHRAAAEPKAHVHSDGSVHSHGNPAGTVKKVSDAAPHDHADGDGTQTSNCCGLFCFTALAQDAPFMLSAPVGGQRTRPALEDAHCERGPDRINRPPIG
jgi:hypothetical protein